MSHIKEDKKLLRRKHIQPGMPESIKKPGILILGASGGVAQSVLQILSKYRELFSSLVLIDRDNRVIRSRYIDHKKLRYTFIQVNFTEDTIKNIIKDVVDKYGVSIVLDLTDQNTLPILSASDSLGLSYLNCSLNSEENSMNHFVESMKSFPNHFTNGVHVLSMGMNPGIANHLIIKGVKEYGVPLEFVEIEYDSGMPRIDHGKPFITWSKKQFLNEAVEAGAGYCGPGGIYVELEGKAVDTLVDTKEFLEPIKKLSVYPMGMPVSHDEVIAMSRILEIPGRFIYAIHPLSLDRIKKILKEGKPVSEAEMVFEENTLVPLDGSDCIGIWLKYPDKEVCYYIDIKHSEIKGTSATLFMVAVGVVAGLLDMLENPLLENGVYSVLDLNNDNFLTITSQHIKIKKVLLKETILQKVRNNFFKPLLHKRVKFFART